jgi:rare lipoprotein A
MSSVASSSQRIDGSGTSLSARCGRGVIAFIYCGVLLTSMVWPNGDEGLVVSIGPAGLSDLESDVVVVSIPNVEYPKKVGAEADSSGDAATPPGRTGTRPVAESTAELPRRASSAPGLALMPKPITLLAAQTLLRAMKIGRAGARRNAMDPLAYGRRKLQPKFVAAYRSLLKLVAVMALPRIRQNAALTHATIVGTASIYNPYDVDEIDAGGVQTASGEPYEPTAWTAAIRTNLRERFGGVRYGKLYHPAYALVERGDKRVIVKINDIGPLRPDRVIDLNERSMRYFDPFLRRGLIPDVKVTLLPGEDWTPGPVGGEQLISFASAQ